MDTSIIITGIIGLGAGLAIGGAFWGRYADTVKAQAEEIDALQSDNLRLRGQAAELATLAHEAHDKERMAYHQSKSVRERGQIAEGMLLGEIEAHRATKRKLAAAKGQITKLRRMV